MRSLLGCIVAGCLGLALAVLLLPGVEIEGNLSQSIKILLLAGIVLGLVNFFIKPLINIITFPLRLITFGLFGLAINMAVVWGIDVLLPKLVINGILPLLETSLLVWLADLLAPKRKKHKEED